MRAARTEVDLMIPSSDGADLAGASPHCACHRARQRPSHRAPRACCLCAGAGAACSRVVRLSRRRERAILPHEARRTNLRVQRCRPADAASARIRSNRHGSPAERSVRD